MEMGVGVGGMWGGRRGQGGLYMQRRSVNISMYCIFFFFIYSGMEPHYILLPIGISLSLIAINRHNI